MSDESDNQKPPGEAKSDVLVVVSKLKAYIKAKSGMNTSDGVISVISDQVRQLCDQAAANAQRDGRKTVMDRDFLALTTTQPSG
jgi:histone H3/H4